MAEIKLTAAQEKAVNYGRGNLLISAAAGSGKTATLSTRITNLILTGQGELSKMLIVTFTRASAAEMRERISRKLHEAADACRTAEPEVRARISKAIGEISSAEISTIHSFLYKALRPYFGTLGISADARIAEQQVVDALKKECMKNVADDFFDGNGDERVNFPELADVIGRVRDSEAVDGELLWLANALQSCGKNASDLIKYAEKLDAVARGESDILSTEFGGVIRKTLSDFAEHYRNVLAYYGEEMPWEEEVWKKYSENHGYMTGWIDGLREMLRSDMSGFASFAEHFGSYAPPRLGTLSAKNKTELSERFKAHRDDLKKDIGRLAENFFSGTPEEAVLSAEKTAEILRSAAIVLECYFEKISRKKRSLSMIDYNDLEEFATKLFLDEDGNVTETGREAGEKYNWIFIDEYQDTNRVQDRIFCAVSGNASRFIVGDIKQSIYRFRGANPDVFAEYRRNWNGEGDGESIFMSENFRCDSPVIDFVNLVSRHTLTKTAIPYEREDDLVFGKGSGGTDPVEICLIRKDSADSENKYSPDVRERNPEAWYAAGRIRDLIGRYSPDGTAILKPEDVAILLRSPSSTGQDYIEALALHGIPAAMKTSKKMDEYASVMLLICLLRVISNPLEDVYLAGALRSPVFGFTAGEIIRIRQLAGEMPLYFGLDQKGAAEEIQETDENIRYGRALQWIRRQRMISDGMSVEKYLEQLIEECEIKSMDGIRGNGSETEAIGKFVSVAKQYESGGSDGRSGIGGFLEYLENALGGSESEQTSLQPDSVQIVSIHSSKGLEYPVVFLSECTKQRNTQDEMRTILFDADLGLGMYLPDSTGLTRSDNLIRRAVAEKIRTDSVSEEMRMLYVAQTRARNKLIITAKTKDSDGDLRDAEWEAAFADPWSVTRCRNYLEWILQACSLCGNHKPFRILEIDPEEEAGIEPPADDGIDEEDMSGETVLPEIADWKYPYDYLGGIPSKLAVSRLHPEILDEYEAASAEPEFPEDDGETVMKKPDFLLGNSGVSGRERGLATHKFLQFVDFKRLNEEGYEPEIERLLRDGYLSAQESGMIDLSHIRRFLKSQLLRRIIASSMVKREFRFNVRMPAEDFTEDAAKKEALKENSVKVTVQGVVDCVFEYGGELVLVDYKTDYFTGEEYSNWDLGSKKLVDRYGNQLKYYARICSQLFGREISKVYIYSTARGELVEV